MSYKVEIKSKEPFDQHIKIKAVEVINTTVYPNGIIQVMRRAHRGKKAVILILEE